MSLFKKPKRNFRQRIARSDSEDEGDVKDKTEDKQVPTANDDPGRQTVVSGKTNEPGCNATNNSSAVVHSEKEMKGEKSELPEKHQVARPPSKLLSFHDEEDDGEVFKVKKSNYSRRLAKQLEKERKKRQEKTVKPKEETEQDAQINKTEVDSQQNKGEEISNEEQKKEAPDIINGEDAEDMEIDSGDESNEKGSQPIQQFKNVLKSGVIPDAATIYAVKKQRQMAREMGDFIPVGDNEQFQENKSRLIRDDDNDRSDDDDDDDEESGRLSFTVNVGAAERQKVRAAFLSVQEGEANDLENDEADELERWEREQIRKGVSIAQLQVSQQPQVSERQLYGYSQTTLPEDEKSLFTRCPLPEEESKSVPKPPLPSSKPNKVTLTTEMIKTRLRERLKSLEEVHQARKLEQTTCRNDLNSAQSRISQLEKEGPLLANRFSLYQQMRGYVTDLVECLDIKVPLIETLERQLMEILKNRAERLIRRRQQDIRDQSDEYSMLSSKILRGSSLDVIDEKSNVQDDTKLRRIAEREGRRMRRRKAREAKQLTIKHEEGMSSDDEEQEIDVIKFRNKKNKILEEAETVFEDTVDEFGTLQGPKNQLEQWRKDQLSTYKDAYVPLCMPKIFAPFVQLELLNWNPLESSKDLESMSWYEALVFFGCKEDGTTEIDINDDPDINLIPSIVEKVVITKLTGLAQNVWDPMSTRQTLQLVSLTKKWLEDYSCVNGKSKHMQAFLKAVIERFYKTLDEDVFIPLYPKELLENRNYGAASFFNRQFWSCVKLLRNILSWHGVLAETPLQELALASLLNRYLILALHNSQTQKDTLEKCRMIVSTFPRAWFTQLKGDSTLSQLQMFCRFLKQFAQLLHVQYLKQDETQAKEAVKEIVHMLITMNALEDAVALAKQYSVGGLKNITLSKSS